MIIKVMLQHTIFCLHHVVRYQVIVYMMSCDPLSPHTSVPMISEDDAREALLEEVSSHCCYGKGAAQQLVFTNITASSAFHVSGESMFQGAKFLRCWTYSLYQLA